MLEVGVESSSASRKSAVAMAVYVMVRDRPGGAPSIWACGFHVGWMDGMGWMARDSASQMAGARVYLEEGAS